MFATRLLLRYAVKPTSPPRNIAPQEITRSFQHEPHVKQYTTACISRTEAKQAIQDANLIKSLRLQKHKLCSRSEPKRPSRRTLSEVEQSIINHPNFEKAAVLVQLLGDNAFVSTSEKPAPHQIGSVPRRKFQNDAQPDVNITEKAVKLVQNALQLNKDTRREEKQEIVKVEPAVSVKKIEQKKPYVINIYLDTKQNKTSEDDDIKKKIKEFWEENVKKIEKKHQSETIRKKTIENTVNAVGNAVVEKMVHEKVVKKEETSKTPQVKTEKLMQENALEKEDASKMRGAKLAEEEVVEEEEVVQKPTKKKVKSSSKVTSNSPKENENVEEDNVEPEVSYDRPRYRVSPVQKLYPNPTSTANPHTERLAGGTPRNYDLEERIKEMVARVTPVSTGGFSKYLTFWKDMWTKKHETKENRNENPTSEEDPPKQPFKRIQGDNVFKEEKGERKNPYEPIPEDQETVVQKSKEYSDESEIDSEREKSPKSSYRHQQRNYSTTTNLKPHRRALYEDGHLCSRSKGTTHIQIMDRANLNRQSLENYKKTYFSTICKPICRCDAKTAGGIGSKESKSSQTRVDEFVHKLKDALAVETKGNYKEVKILYGGKQGSPNREIKVSDRNLSTAQGKQNGNRTSKRGQNEEIDIKRKFQSIKKKLKSDD